MKKIILSALVCTMLYSCATLKVPSNKIDMEDMQLRMGVEMYDMLFTLYNTERTKSSSSYSDNGYGQKVKTTSSTNIATANHPIGVYIGNDIFVDMNGNISLSILDYYNLRDKESWEIEYYKTGNFRRFIAKKNGKNITYSFAKSDSKAISTVTLDILIERVVY